MIQLLDLKKKVGFILTSSALGMYLVGLVGYIIFSFGVGSAYFDGGILATNIIFLVLCLGLSFIKYTEKYSPIVLLVGALICLLSFVSKSPCF